MHIIGATADKVFVKRRLKTALMAEPINHAAHLAHYFRADTIARQDKNLFHNLPFG
jgi:hypothetical protein